MSGRGALRQAQRALQSSITAVREVIGQRQWIDDAAVGEGQPLLLLEIGNLFGGPETQGVGLAVQKAGVEQACHRFTRDVSKVGHFGTGDLEITLSTAEDLARAEPLIRRSYEAS